MSSPTGNCSSSRYSKTYYRTRRTPAPDSYTQSTGSGAIEGYPSRVQDTKRTNLQDAEKMGSLLDIYLEQSRAELIVASRGGELMVV